ncbi:hypothetical protein GCT19_04160 [Paraburkholderia sp. CNPSo 3155]|uniref:hypothetical protein n=1 Tax=Paraburkholderia atlantica TaxID=2654982 RepID=UPI00128BDC06|nr:hypothetical protein [Paraburkholderia atlantica]MPW04850.1 hypothetical protein [Paraburkholderia atlantica]
MMTGEQDCVSAKFIQQFASAVLSTIASDDRGRAERGEPMTGIQEAVVIAGFMACELCTAMAYADALRSMQGGGHA